jgi:hypothetical protein
LEAFEFEEVGRGGKYQLSDAMHGIPKRCFRFQLSGGTEEEKSAEKARLNEWTLKNRAVIQIVGQIVDLRHGSSAACRTNHDCWKCVSREKVRPSSPVSLS